MDWNKFSLIGHRDHLIFSPIDAIKLERLISHIALPPGACVVDIGAGACEVLIRVLEKYPATGIGVDLREECRAEAYRRAEGRVKPGQLTFVHADCRTVPRPIFWPPFRSRHLHGLHPGVGGISTVSSDLTAIRERAWIHPHRRGVLETNAFPRIPNGPGRCG